MSHSHDHAHAHAENIKTTRDETRWEIEVTGEIPAAALAEYRTHSIKELGADTTIDGFRPGKAPEAALVRHFGEEAILQHAAEHAVKHEIPEILAKEQVNIVDAPRVSIEPPALDKPLKFTARAPLAPKVILGDYKKASAKKVAEKKEQEVTDKEYSDAILHLRRERARIELMEGGKKSDEAADESKNMVEKDLPVLDDAFAQSVGYDDSAKFHETIRTNMKNEKDMREGEKVRASILEAIVKDSKINYPAILREYEIDDMEARMAGDLERMGMTIDSYLKSVKKTKEDIRKEWESPADERAKVRLVLAEIARIEKIEPDAEKLAQELKHAKDHYKDADENILHAHIAHALRNEAVMTWLEAQKN